MVQINKKNVSFSKLQFNYTSKDFYKKYFFHKFKDFQNFDTQLSAYNAEDPNVTYTYNGEMFDGKMDFRHLLFEYFFNDRSGDDEDVEMGVGIDFASGEQTASANNLPDYEALKWIPFNNIHKSEVPDYSDPDSAPYAAKSKKISLKTYPSYYKELNEVKSFNENWFKYFKLNDIAQVEALQNNGIVSSSINQLYSYLNELDLRFPLETVKSFYTTTKKYDGKISNYDEVRSKVSKLNDYSEINFDDPIWKLAIDGDAKCVESAWQLQDIDGQKVMAICMSDDEKNIIHERYSNGKLYAVNIPSENIYRETSGDSSTIEELTIDLRKNVVLKSDVMAPWSAYNSMVNNPDLSSLDEYTSTEYCEDRIVQTDIDTYLSGLSGTDLTDAQTNILYTYYIGRLLVMGKTNMKAKPYDDTRFIDAGVADDDGYVPLDKLREDLNTRYAEYISSGAGDEDTTYPWKDGNGNLKYTLFSQFDIETNYYAGEIIDGEFQEGDNGWELVLKVKSVPLSQIREKTSPLGNIFGQSHLSEYETYGESGSLSNYMTSFRFFDPSVMSDHTNNSNYKLDTRYWFANRDTFGAFCPTLNEDFYENIDDFHDLIVVNSKNQTIDPDSAMFTDLQVYFGFFMGSGLWQKGFEIIIDQNFANNPTISALFTDIDSEFNFTAVARDLSDYDFTDDNLPISDDDYNPDFNLMDNTLPSGKTIMPQVMFFIPWDNYDITEKWWLSERADADGETLSIADYTWDNARQYCSCYVQYQEDSGTSDYTKDFVDENFNTEITRDSVDGENTGLRNLEWYYCYRPVRHYIQLDSGLGTDVGTGYKFDFRYVWVNDVDESGKDDCWNTLMNVEYSLDRDALDSLYNYKQSTGTFYYLVENEGVTLITPDHSLYGYTVIQSGENTPPLFFQPGSVISLSIKGEYDNKSSTDVLSSTINEIVNDVSSQWNSTFRGVQTDYVKSTIKSGDTRFSNAPTLENDRAKLLKAPYGDCWIKLGDVEDSDYMGGYKLVNHNYYYPADWALNGVIITGKQWENKTDLEYYAYNTNLAHFFIDDTSEITYTVNKSSTNIKNMNNDKLYIGSFVIPPTGFFNVNESALNINNDHQQSISIIKEKQNVDLLNMRDELNEHILSNSRENINGLMFTGYGNYTQMVTLGIDTQNDLDMFNKIIEGQEVSQDDIKKGVVMKKIGGTFNLVVKLYNPINTINNSSKLSFSFI